MLGENPIRYIMNHYITNRGGKNWFPFFTYQMLSLTIILRLLCISILLNYSYVCVVFYKLLKTKNQGKSMKNRWTKRTKRANGPPGLVSRRDPVGFTPGVRIVSEKCNNSGALWFYILIPREGTGLRRGMFELWSRSVPSILYNEYIIEEFILYIESCLPQYPWSWLHHDTHIFEYIYQFHIYVINVSK